MIRYETGLPKQALRGVDRAATGRPTRGRAADRPDVQLRAEPGRADDRSKPRRRPRASAGRTSRCRASSASAAARTWSRVRALSLTRRPYPGSARMPISLDTDVDPPLARDRAGRARARAGQPEPARRARSWCATARCSARASTPPTARRTPSARRSTRARTDPRGATLYVSLEPCCHHGQTPPCTDAILEAGIAAWSSAPTTRPRRRPAAGWGSCATRGSRSSSPTASRRCARGCSTRRSASTPGRGRPHVLFKSAMTLDGKVATRTGDSKWISGEESRLLSHHWRAERDAVVGRDRHRAGRRPAAHRPDRGRAAPAAPRRVRLRGAAAARLPARPRRARASR